MPSTSRTSATRKERFGDAPGDRGVRAGAPAVRAVSRDTVGGSTPR
jgi:hypothetical protein